MKSWEYVLLVSICMATLGMATAPPKPAYTPFVNAIIQKCINQYDDCTNDVLYYTNEYRNQIINKFGNVL